MGNYAGKKSRKIKKQLLLDISRFFFYDKKNKIKKHCREIEEKICIKLDETQESSKNGNQKWKA